MVNSFKDLSSPSAFSSAFNKLCCMSIFVSEIVASILNKKCNSLSRKAFEYKENQGTLQPINLLTAIYLLNLLLFLNLPNTAPQSFVPITLIPKAFANIPDNESEHITRRFSFVLLFFHVEFKPSVPHKLSSSTWPLDYHKCMTSAVPQQRTVRSTVPYWDSPLTHKEQIDDCKALERKTLTCG